MELELPGVRLWYEDSGGSGAAVVFVHAASGSSGMWQHQVPAFGKAGCRVITYDRRGYGRSRVEQNQAQPGCGADDLQGLVDKLGLDRFHLVGTAAGGIVATDYALSSAQRLRSLVIANSIVGVQDEDYLELGRRLRPSPQFEALPADFRELGPSYRAANPDGTRRWAALAQPRAPDQKMRNRITFAALETIKTPTLLITGDADLYSPPPVLRLFAARIRHAESLVIAECGHSAYWEQPEIFNRALLDFIGGRNRL
jgi:pimeloyl-ACP methyl ester carboxylesterase